MVKIDGNLGLSVDYVCGGPNHCRVGRAGSQFYSSSGDLHLCMQSLIARPCRLFVHHGCVLFVVGIIKLVGAM
jgi:hypothetical protein